MKQLLRFFMLWLIGLMATSLQAQTWTASPVGNGTFYLYNVGNEGFLVGGNDQTTRASLTSQGGIPVTLLPTATVGEYYISTAPTYPDRFLGSDGYVDKLSSSSKYTSWKFVAVDGLDNTYTIQATNDTKNYIFGHNTDVTKTTVNATAPNNSKAYWKLVTKEDLITNLANATESNPIDVTWAVMNPYFGAYCDIPLWTGDYTTYNGVDNNKCIEQWNRTFDMYQTITGLPNGVYKMQCQGFYRMGGGGNDAGAAATARTNGTEVLNAKYYINSTEGTLKSIFDYGFVSSSNTTYNSSTAFTVSGNNCYVPNNLNRASSCFLSGEYVNEPIRAVVTDGIIKIGFRKTVTSSEDWAAYDNVTLTYCGIDLSALLASYEEQLAIAKALQSEPMQASLKSALDAAVTAAETDVNTDSQEWLESTLSTLGTAITNAQTSNDLYTGAILTAVNGMKAQSTSESVKSALQTKYDEGEYTSAADVYAIYQPLEIAALSRDANTSYTSAIINPSFELGNTDGWNCLTTGNDTGVQHTDNATYSYSDTDGDYLFNSWATSIKTLDVGQTVTGLPAGYYTLSAVVAGFGDGAPITLTANGESVSVSHTNADVNAEKAIGHTLTVENIFVFDGSLTFRVQNTGKGQTLMKADHFQLIYTSVYEAPNNYTDLVYNINVENGEVADYLANTTYTESTATVIGNYSTDAALRNDQPNTVMVPLPAQTVDATLSLALNSTYTDAETFSVAASSVLYEVMNLLPQQTYYYKVEVNDVVVANGTITTTGHLRMMKADGIANMRDLGGWTNADGNRIRYGKLFRGTELAAGKTYTASDGDLQMLANLGIGAEVDLREDKDFASGTISNSVIDGATYYYANLSRWSEDALNFDNAKFKSAFDLILAALKADKAAYFHCIFGADRTGCFAMLLEGLLGLPVDQLYKDYELTSFSSAGLRDKTGIDHKLQYIKALQGDNLQQKFYNYWRGAVGVSETDLNDFINIMVDGTSPITTAELADLPTKAVEDGEYYIYFPVQDKFLSRGRYYGTQGVPDNYGVPAQVTTNGTGVSTIKFLDNGLYFGSDGYTDKVASFNTVSWFVESSGDDLVLKSHNGKYFYMKDGTRAYVDAATAAGADPVIFKTRIEHDAIVAAKQAANVLSAATAAGITAADISTFNSTLSADYTAIASTATILSATSGSTTSWVLTEPANKQNTSANYGNAYNAGDYGGELYQRHGYVSQTVTVPHAGLYKLTLNALFRQGSNATCYALGQKGYELSNAYVSINDEYFAQIPSWYSDCAGNANPDNTTQAKALIDADKYAVELYAYIGESKTATIKVNVPDFTPWAWCIFNNFALTEYAKKVTLDETDTDAPEACDFADVTLNRTITEGFNTLCLPFSLTAEEVQAAFGDDVKVYTLTDETETGLDTYTLNFTEGTAITANMPAIISGVSSEKVASSYTFTGVTIAPSLAPTSSTEHFDFIGTYTATTIPIGDYFLKKGSSEIVKSVGNTIKGFRAYIASKTVGEARAFSLTFEDIPTIIGEVNSERVNSKEMVGPVYDLSGRRVHAQQRGLYIVDGKKVLIK